MGNHEYCTECGQSDFHNGRPCQDVYPKEYVEHQKALREMAERVIRQKSKASIIRWELKQLGYPAELDDYGHVVIRYWSL